MKKRIAIAAAVVLVLALALNPCLQTTHYTLKSPKLTGETTIAVLSDLHNSFYGKNQERLAAAIHAQSPDAVAMVGDMAESLEDMDGVNALLDGLGGAYPVYYVTGNHEIACGEGEQIKQALRDRGVIVLENESAVLGEIRIVGLDDPAGTERKIWRSRAEELRAQDDVFTILLSHRPVQTIYYALHKGGYDLILSGHAHGGQLRIPGLMNGIWAPDEGLFPEYAAGMYELKGDELDTARGGYDFDTLPLLVSRGLCRNRIPRVFNRPELAVVHLEPAE